MANIPTVSWDETNPIGYQAKSLGATRIREFKTQIREIIAIDHIVESTGSGTTWGYHNKLTFYSQLSNPLPSSNTGCLFSKDVSSKSELFWVDEYNNYIQITSNGKVIVGLVGEVRIWSGTLATIPTGWALCDGNGGRPNLIAKFIRGINTKTTEPLANSGGSDSITLSTSTTPTHTHTIGTGSHIHDLKYYVTGGSSTTITGAYHYAPEWDTLTYSESSHTHTTATDGGGATPSSFDNRPAYIEEAFIIKT